jgi:hypothetical protein
VAWADSTDPIEKCATTAEAGMDARQDGRFADALEAFKSCADDACPAIVRNDCRTSLAELSEKGPRLSFRVREGGKDVAGAEIKVGARVLTSDERTAGLLLNAGTHRVEVRAGERRVGRDVVVAAGDGPRTIEIEISAPLAARDETPPQLEVDPVPAIVAGSIGLASLGVAGVLGVWSYVDFREYEDTCMPSCDPDDVSASRARAVGADIALGIGLNAAVAATILFFAGPKIASEGTSVAFRF